MFVYMYFASIPEYGEFRAEMSIDYIRKDPTAIKAIERRWVDKANFLSPAVESCIGPGNLILPDSTGRVELTLSFFVASRVWIVLTLIVSGPSRFWVGV